MHATAKITIFTKFCYLVAKTAKLFIEAQSAPNENYKFCENCKNYYFYKILLYPVAKTAKLFIEAQSAPNQNYKFCKNCENYLINYHYPVAKTAKLFMEAQTGPTRITNSAKTAKIILLFLQNFATTL